MSYTIEELRQQNAGCWLGIRVTRRSRYGQPVEGDLVCRAPTHADLHRLISEQGISELYTTYAPGVIVKEVVRI